MIGGECFKKDAAVDNNSILIFGAIVNANSYLSPPRPWGGGGREKKGGVRNYQQVATKLPRSADLGLYFQRVRSW